MGTCLTKRLLKSGHTVKIADKRKSVTYPELWLRWDDVTPKSLYDEVNVQESENICSACSELGIHRIIFTSSVAV